LFKEITLTATELQGINQYLKRAYAQHILKKKKKKNFKSGTSIFNSQTFYCQTIIVGCSVYLISNPHCKLSVKVHRFISGRDLDCSRTFHKCSNLKNVHSMRLLQIYIIYTKKLGIFN